MQATGNSNIDVCVANLLRLRRGECGYSRIKGIDQSIIDDNLDAAELDLLEDVEFVVDTYETRVSLDDLEIESDVNDNDTYTVKVLLNDAEEESDDIEENI